ncbi:hypothetical protein [Mycobacterium sp. C31M]
MAQIATTTDGVIEYNGMLWKPRRGATATADEFIAAQDTCREISADSRWNPWVAEDRAAEHEAAAQVVGQWRRAEPGHRMLTMKQIEARWAREDRQRETDRAKQKQAREERKAHYDEHRATARLSLFENQSALQHDELELTGYMDGTRAPKMDADRRREQIVALQQSIETRRREIDRLIPIVGDPETVFDQNGWLPSERRDAMLLHYRYERERRVRKLRTEIPELAATVERGERWKLDSMRRELDALLAVPPLTADDMCSDCATPIARHGWSTPPFDGPCPAWPRWRARLKKAWAILEAGSRDATKQVGPTPPKPQPLATIPSGLPIAEVTRRLQELEEQFPEAEVRRGRANRWELWPKES